MFKRGSLGLCIIVLILAFAGRSDAANFKVIQTGNIVVAEMSGDIEAGDLARFKRALNRFGYITNLYLDSPGGNLNEALLIGREIRKNNIATGVRAKSVCLSACPYIFIGGLFRTIEPTGVLGMHMASISQIEDARMHIAEIFVEDSLSINDRVSIIIAILEQTGAKGLMNQVIYLLDMGVSPKLLDYVILTNHYDMYYFSEKELRMTNVIN